MQNKESKPSLYSKGHRTTSVSCSSKKQNVSKGKSQEMSNREPEPAFDRNCTFGTSKRFNSTGMHPGLIKIGRNNAKLAPGQYTYDDRLICAYKKRQISTWTKAKQLEEFSKNLGYRNADILEHRIFMSKHLGPGSHDIVDGIGKDSGEQRCNGFGYERNVKDKKFSTPAPGTYFYNVKSKEIVPSVKIGKEERFRSEEKPWMLPPNRYTLKSVLRDLLDKMVSKRGPYDLFSGDRSNNNTHNKFAVLPSCAPDKFYKIASGFDYLLYDKQRKRHGKFLQAPRFPVKPTERMMMNDISLCYKDPTFPGPDTYDLPGGIQEVPEALHSFGTSQIEIRPGVRWLTSPGPGRYNEKSPKCEQCKGSYVFKSVTRRHEYKAPIYNAF